MSLWNKIKNYVGIGLDTKPASTTCCGTASKAKAKPAKTKKAKSFK